MQVIVEVMGEKKIEAKRFNECYSIEVLRPFGLHTIIEEKDGILVIQIPEGQPFVIKTRR